MHLTCHTPMCTHYCNTEPHRAGIMMQVMTIMHGPPQLSIFVYVLTCMYVCMYVCICVYVYIYMYVNRLYSYEYYMSTYDTYAYTDVYIYIMYTCTLTSNK